MLEIIHDLAPGATLGFASGTQGISSLVHAIDFLQNEFEADIIVDDVGYPNQPFFENGIVSIRAQNAVNAGVVFISAAGNDGQRHYQAPLNVADNRPFNDVIIRPHQFAPNDLSQSFDLQTGEAIEVVLQWDNPFGNAEDDLNVYLLDGDSIVAQSAEVQPIETRQPLEIVRYISDQQRRIDVVVDALTLRSSITPTIEMLFVTSHPPEYRMSQDSIFGHPAVPDVISVGAAGVVSPTQIQPYSSQGPVSIRHPVPEERIKPDVIATDCVDTSVPGVFQTFCGTSAAAPHVAALAALLLEAEPEADPQRIRTLLADTAVDLGETGVDTVFGAGRVDAMEALLHSRYGRNPNGFTLAIPLISR